MSLEIVELGLKVAKFLATKIVKKRLSSKFKGNKKEKSIVVLEAGREIANDVQDQLGEIDAIIKAGIVSKDQMHELAADVYKAIKNLQRVSKKIILVLSGPVVLSFLVGQLVGLNHFNLELAWWQRGSYEILDDMTPHRAFIL